ncbi:twin-arginine translocation signal domain-containing protein [Gemmatimonas groenlandica]|uniref:Twin-arginine translocation signal domain-containing protein n=1 Tax=Gemmatimonas groenlandica TaxID=2732249 RepID=A0A6M4IJC3_9BACT|nr:twin-arginine translocation signal domain-containing protein [Gemmatimonas groenlandica]QJR34165.1 twin-arginine translocation signal domain-containing protein [Gemmatimonas groenlandica]
MTSRRSFLKTAGALTAGVAAVGTSTACAVKDPTASNATGQENSAERVRGFDRVLLDAVATAVLPASLGATGIRTATNAFVAWADGYEPVAEEMHGYGYADVRYLPADPSPAWRAQLTALDLLAHRYGTDSFSTLPLPRRRELLRAVLRDQRGDRLPSPLDANHVAIALLAHWSSGPDAWDAAIGARVAPGVCRTLGDATRKPLPLATEPRA